jgi:excisionase family DNA binding protein
MHPVIDHDQRLYSTAETCRILACGPTKLYEKIANGELDARKMGSKTVITGASITALCDALAPAAVRAPTSMRRRAERENVTSK